MESNEIQHWLDTNGAYSEGVELYAALPNHNPTLLRNLKNKESSLLKEKLIAELKKLVGIKKPVIKTIVVGHGQPEVILRNRVAANDVIYIAEIPEPKKQQDPVNFNKVLFHQLPAELRPDLLAAGNLFKENCLLKTQLNDLLPEQENEALEIQLKIFYNFKMNAHHWARIDYWKTHRKLPAPILSKSENLNPFLQIKRQQNLFSSISRLKKRLSATEEQLLMATKVKDKTRLEKKVAKQKNNLLKQEQQLMELTALIEKRNE